MKSQATLLLIVLALGLSHCSPANWAGVWKLTEGDEYKCAPIYELIISQIDRNLEFEWMNSDECSFSYFSMKAPVPVPEENSVDLKAESAEFSGRLLLQGDKLVFISQKGAYFTYNRAPASNSAQFVGYWMVDKTDSECCPKEVIAVNNAGSALTFSWTWDSSRGCKELELDGKKFINSVPIPERINSVDLYYYVNGVKQRTSFDVYQERGAFSRYNKYGYCTINRKSDSHFAKFMKWIFA